MFDFTPTVERNKSRIQKNIQKYHLYTKPR